MGRFVASEDLRKKEVVYVLDVSMLCASGAEATTGATAGGMDAAGATAAAGTGESSATG